jgi:hypothetical protein
MKIFLKKETKKRVKEREIEGERERCQTFLL